MRVVVGRALLAAVALQIAGHAGALLAQPASSPPPVPAPPGEAAAPAPAQPPAIEWMDWSDKAFARATAEGKPILLYVRAPWSRASLWTEQLNFTDPEVVKLVNDRWVPVRVDRDRRPDIDLRYQVAVNAAFPGEAGWPLTAFLFDSGEVFYGSSFISMKDRRDRPGLKSLLQRTADFYATSREKAAGTREVVKMAFQRELAQVREPEYGLPYLEAITKDMVSELDQSYGGYGEASRVPMLYTLQLAGTVYQRVQKQELLDVVVKSLRGMERGAIYDRVGGGFHRAVTDAAWRVPEFEKLLNYNAPLLVDYLMGYEITGDVDMKNAAESTLAYLLGTLKDPAGGFYLGQWSTADADEPRGDFYAWSESEFKANVPPALSGLARALYNVTPEGDLVLGPPPRSLLYLSQSREEVADRLKMSVADLRKGEAEILAALAKTRAARSAPPIEKAIYVDSTASGAIAMFEAWRVLGREDALAAGLSALDRLLAAVPQGSPLLHRVQPPPEPGVDPPLALDHMMLAQACLAGYEATGEAKYLAAARVLVDRATSLFWDGEAGGFFDVVADPNAKGYLTIRRRLPNDTAYPAMNSLAARVLARLTLLTGDASYREKGEVALKQLCARAKDLNYRMGGLGLALDAYLRAPTRYLVVGAPEDPKVRDLQRAASRLFDPGKLIVRLAPGRDDAQIAKLKLKDADGPCVVVCRMDQCSEPATDEASLKERVTRPSR